MAYDKRNQINLGLQTQGRGNVGMNPAMAMPGNEVVPRVDPQQPATGRATTDPWPELFSIILDNEMKNALGGE